METHTAIVELLDVAKSVVGSDYKVAKAIGATPQRISNWRTGQATCPVADVALLAHVAGIDPVAEIARAVVRKHEGTPKGDRLMRALGKALLVTGAAIGSAGASATVIFSFTTASHEGWRWGLCLLHTMYIM